MRHIAIGGIKTRANASKNETMNYIQMKEEEERLEPVLAELLKSTESGDEGEHQRYGKDKGCDELPRPRDNGKVKLALI